MKDKTVEIMKENLYASVLNDGSIEGFEEAAEEIYQLYSAGEEVSDEEIEDMAYQNNWGLSEDFAITFQEGFTEGSKWMRSKLTRPVVTEEEIEKVLYQFRAKGIESDGSTSVGFIPPTKHKELAKAIKELLT